MSFGVYWGPSKRNGRTFGQPENITKRKTTLVVEAEHTQVALSPKHCAPRAGAAMKPPTREHQANEDVEIYGKRMRRISAELLRKQPH